VVLRSAYERARADFAKDPEGAAALLKVGESPRDTTADTVELAALTTVASTILNLDEALVKE
jgi:hypothetical protein